MSNQQVSFQKIHMQLSHAEWKAYDFITGIPDHYIIESLDNPSYEVYRSCSDAVGEDYGWHLRPTVQNSKVIVEEYLHADVSLFFKFKNDFTGYCMIVADNKADTIEIADFGFVPKYRGKGLGQALFPKMLEKAFEFHFNQVVLTTRSTNDERVPEFYQNFGFKVVKIEDKIEEVLRPDDIYLNKKASLS